MTATFALPRFALTRATPLARSTIAAIDIGSSQVSCLIADCNDGTPTHAPFTRVLGFAQYPTAGVKRGQVVDMRAAEDSIRAAVDQAELVAKTEVRHATIGISAHHIMNHHFDAHLQLRGNVVTPQHIEQVLSAAYRQFTTDDAILHAIPMHYSLDDAHGLTDPTGMCGDTLTAHLYLMSAPTAPMRNLLRCVSHCHLECDRPLFSPYASALATLQEDEKDLGALHIDMGGGTTSISLFCNGAPLVNTILPIGGAHVTNDIAQGLGLAPSEAERVKKRFGSALAHAPTPTQREQFEAKYQNGESRILPCGELTRIIRPRIEEIFEHIATYLEKHYPQSQAIGRVVLTGGAAQLSGVSQVAEMMFKKHARLATPHHISGLPEAAATPDFAAAVGLLQCAARSRRDAIATEIKGRSMFGRVSHWLRRHI